MTQKLTRVERVPLTGRVAVERDTKFASLGVVLALAELGAIDSGTAVEVRRVARYCSLTIDEVSWTARNTPGPTFAICVAANRESGLSANCVTGDSLIFLTADPDEMRREASALDADAAHALNRSRELARTANAIIGTMPRWYATDAIGQGRRRLSSVEADRADVLRPSVDSAMSAA